MLTDDQEQRLREAIEDEGWTAEKIDIGRAQRFLYTAFSSNAEGDDFLFSIRSNDLNTISVSLSHPESESCLKVLAQMKRSGVI